MPDDLHRRSHAVFMRAIEIDAPARLAFVEEQCGGDAKLLGRVRALIDALDESNNFLETPALGTRAGQNGTDGHDPIVPQSTIGGYQILRVIGVGGMATVYEAVQDRPRRRVALKVMKRGLERTGALHRFKFETEVLARLRHPGIAQIFEAGASHDGHGSSIPFFAMEHIEGARPITASAEERGLNLPGRLAMVAAVADAVQHGHQSGVIHRDLKPSNILVDSAGRPKVIDFGVARASNPEQAWITELADRGQIIGTLNYMSPEQCNGGADVDIRADVYALGIVLYELVTGRLPHDLSRVPVPEAMRIVRDVTPPRPSTFNPACRGDIDAIVMKAIEKDPDRRYPSAASLAADLRRFLRSETIEARPPTVFYQWRLFARRNRALVGAIAALAITIIAGGLLSAAFGYRAMLESRRRLAAETKAIEDRDAAVWQGYIANIAAALSAFNSGEVYQARSRLADAAPVHRGWEWRFISGLAERTLATIQAHEDMIFAFATTEDCARIATGSRDGTIRIWNVEDPRLPVEIEGHGTPVHSIAFSPAGDRVASAGADGTLRVWDAQTGQELRTLAEHPRRLISLAWSRTGLIAAAADDGVARIWSEHDPEPARTLDDQPGGVHGLAFSRDGTSLATWNRGGTIWVRSADGAELLHALEFPSEVYCAAVSDDGTLFAAGGDGGNLAIWDARTGQLIHRLKLNASISAVRALSFSPSGRMLASGHGDRAIALWSVATGEQHFPLLRGHEDAIAGLRISPDGSRIYSASWDRTIRVWSLEGEHPAELITTLRGHTGRITEAQFSPDGSIIASSSLDGTIRLWDPEFGRSLGVIAEHGSPVYAVCFSPDGRLLASGAGDRTVRLWNATTGQEVSKLEGHTGNVHCLAFSPDGRLLASAGDDLVVRIWDVSSGRELRTMPGHTARVHCLAFSPDGRTLASSSHDTTVRLWNATTGAAGPTLTDHVSDVMAVLFSPDGRSLYTGSRDQTIRVWSMQTLESRVLDGHGQYVTSFSFSPDGSRLAAGSWFGELVLWDVATHQVVLSFKAHDTVTRQVAFDPSGRLLASASYDQTIRLYDAIPKQDRARLRAALRTTIDAAEALADRLYTEFTTPSRVAEALERQTNLAPDLLIQTRKAILARALNAPPPPPPFAKQP